MSYSEALRNLKKGRIDPCYVLYGIESFLIEKFISELSQQVLDDEDVDFNLEVFDLSQQPIQDAIEAAQTFPFMGGKRLIIADGASFLTGQREDTKIEHDVDQFEAYINSPAEFSVLVVRVNHEKLDERKRIVKSLKKQAIVCLCDAPKDESLQQWMIDYVKGLGVHMEDEAAVMLINFIGSNMQLLARELEKMAQFVGKAQTITLHTVHELVSKTLEQDVFKMVDQAVSSKTAEAIQSFHELIKRQEEPIKILFLLARQIRLIYKAKHVAQQGVQASEAARLLGVHPFVCKLVFKQANNFSATKLSQLLNYLVELDYKIKTGRIDKVLAVELFLVNMRMEDGVIH